MIQSIPHPTTSESVLPAAQQTKNLPSSRADGASVANALGDDVTKLTMQKVIVTYQDLSPDPATCVLHYAFECFEGMKVCKDNYARIRLFRPEVNTAHFNKSATRIALPTFEPKALLDLIGKFVRLKERFIPNARGYSLYQRHTMIGTQTTLGIGPPSSALLFPIASPDGPYYRTSFKANSLEVTSYAVRAWPGGICNKKFGANDAPCVVPQAEAANPGHQQSLWLFAEEESVTEVGIMNLFVAIRSGTEQKELLTAISDGTILEGIILALARERLVPCYILA